MTTTQEAPFTIGMIAFPTMTNLDFVGPHDLLARAPTAKIHILAQSLEPIRTDSGARVLPEMVLEDAPELDMIFIGGGAGSLPLMEDERMLGFLRERAPHAKWVTSVCTGALVLGAAGLLRGYDAATHWTAMEVLPTLGARPVHKRVVIDRNRITGGGVTAGIDFGLTVIDTIWGRDAAEAVQLGNEYDPQPPFNSGSPFTARPEIVERVRRSSADLTAARAAAAVRAAARFAG